MGMDTKTVGGGAATGVSQEFLDALRKGISGVFGGGTDPNSVMGALGYFLGGDTSAQQESLRSVQERQKTEDLARLKAQFGMNTSSLGTPNQVASSRYLSDRSPQDQLALEELMNKNRMQALSFLMPLFGQAIGLGTPQRQTVQTPSTGMNILGAATGIAGAAAPFFNRMPSTDAPAGTTYQTTGIVPPPNDLG